MCFYILRPSVLQQLEEQIPRCIKQDWDAAQALILLLCCFVCVRRVFSHAAYLSATKWKGGLTGIVPSRQLQDSCCNPCQCHLIRLHQKQLYANVGLLLNAWHWCKQYVKFSQAHARTHAHSILTFGLVNCQKAATRRALCAVTVILQLEVSMLCSSLNRRLWVALGHDDSGNYPIKPFQ